MHEWYFGQPLHHAVIVHYDGRIVLSDLRDGLNEAGRQIEFAALPIAWQILSTLRYGAVRFDDTRTSDTD